MDLVEEHIDTHFSIGDLVLGMNMSRSVLYRKLKALTNLSPNEFIRTVRLKRAAQLLPKHNGTVAEISYLVGFNDPGYFTRCFRKQFGRSPKEYVEAFSDEIGQI